MHKKKKKNEAGRYEFGKIEIYILLESLKLICAIFAIESIAKVWPPEAIESDEARAYIKCDKKFNGRNIFQNDCVCVLINSFGQR